MYRGKESANPSAKPPPEMVLPMSLQLGYRKPAGTKLQADNRLLILRIAPVNPKCLGRIRLCVVSLEPGATAGAKASVRLAKGRRRRPSWALPQLREVSIKLTGPSKIAPTVAFARSVRTLFLTL